MFKRIVLMVSAIIGLSFGVSFGASIWPWLHLTQVFLQNTYFNGLLFAIIFALLGNLASPLLARWIHLNHLLRDYWWGCRSDYRLSHLTPLL